MRRLLVLEPAHFHAALTLREPNAGLADEVFVYASEGPDLQDFLALVDRFNRRPERPTRWRPLVTVAHDPLGRLVAERRGEVVVLAGRNGGKAGTIRRLHESGFHVLADKPWLVRSEDLEAVRASLEGWPLVMEIMTGRHDPASRLFKRLVDAPDIFGHFRAEGTAIELDSVHHLDKLVDGAPLRRPWWFFDVRVQGSGAVDIPTHLVDQTQWLLERPGETPAELPRLLAVRAWPTEVPAETFSRITGERAFPPALAPVVKGDRLRYLCNAELDYRIGGVTARASARWDLAPPPGGGDRHGAVAHGTLASVRLEQGPHTGHRRQLAVEPRGDAGSVAQALEKAVAAWQGEFPGVRVEDEGQRRHLVSIPPALHSGHETHFVRVRDEFLRIIDSGRWPADLVARTAAKYALLAQAVAALRLEES